MSNLTAFNYIGERSEATPGLWNAIFSQLSENIATLDFTSGGTTSISSGLSIGNDLWVKGQVISGQDASITTRTLLSLGTNSNEADYIRFSDTSASRSNYILGSHVGATADGLNIWDDSAGTMIVSFSKQSVRFFQNVVGKAFDTGGQVFNVISYGATGDGVTDDTGPITAAIRDARLAGGGTIYFPSPSSWYVVSSTLTVGDGIGLRGERFTVAGSQNVQYSILSRNGHFSIVSSYGTRGGTHQGGLRIENLQFSGGDFGQPLLDLRSQVFFLSRGVRLFASNGSPGAYLEEMWDSAIYNWYVDFCGSTNTAAAIAIYSGGSDNCNQLRFVDCDFESNPGCIIESLGSGTGTLTNNELYFTRCKFESLVATSANSQFMRFDKNASIFIQDCTWTYGNSSLITTVPANIVVTDSRNFWIGGFFETIGSSTTRNLGSFISLSGVTQVDIAAVFAISSTNTLSSNTAITTTTGVGQVDVFRSAFDPSANPNNAALIGPTWGAKRHHTAVDTDALSVGTVGLTMTPASGASFLGLGTSSATCHLHVVSAGLSAASQGILVQDITTNAANKVGRLKSAHYTNAEEPTTMMIANNSVTDNIVQIGGGSGVENAATSLRFYTADGNTILAGTIRLQIDSKGTVDLRGGPLKGLQSGAALGPSVAFSSETSLGFFRSGVSAIGQSYGTLNLAAGSAHLWASGISVGNATAGGTLIPAISSTSSLVAAFVVQGSASSFTVVTWAAAQPGDQILTTVMQSGAVSSLSSGLVLHSHCTQAGQIEFRLSNVSTLAQNQSSRTYFFTRITPF